MVSDCIAVDSVVESEGSVESGLSVVRISRFVMVNEGEPRALDVYPAWAIRNLADKHENIVGGSIEDIEEFRKSLKIREGTPAHWGRTFFRKRLYLAVRYRGDDFYTRYYADELKSFIVGDVFVPVKDATLEDVLKLCPADEAVAYLKEKGLSVCPVMG